MTQSKTTIFTAALSLAILLTFSCSSSDDGGGGGGSNVPTQSSETEGSISSSSNENGSVPTQSSEAKDFNNSSSSKNGSVQILYCDYGPVTQYGGGCFEIEKESECDLQWGQVVATCGGQSSGSNQSSSSGYTFSQFFNGTNEAWTTNAGRGFILHSDSTCTGIRETEIGSNIWNQDGGSVRPKLTFQYEDGNYTILIREECWFAGVHEPLRVINLNTLQGSRTVTRKSIGSSSSSSSSSAAGGLCATNCTLTDARDGRTYKCVKIGTQTWMAENLYYGCSDSGCDNTYGNFYKWITAMDLPSSCNSSSCASQILDRHKGICPSGWHIPKDAEWSELRTFVGSNTGTKLKTTSGWKNNGNGTDDYCFSAQPSGYYNTSLQADGSHASWWSVKEFDNLSVYWYELKAAGVNLTSTTYGSKTISHAVRCIKD